MDANRIQKEAKYIYYKYLWWIWQAFLVGSSVFFTILGIYLLFGAYRLKDPFSFILCFFASNLMILVSVVLLIGLLYRLIRVYRLIRPEGEDG